MKGSLVLSVYCFSNSSFFPAISLPRDLSLVLYRLLKQVVVPCTSSVITDSNLNRKGIHEKSIGYLMESLGRKVGELAIGK